MKTKLLVILLISISLFFIACDEDSITEAVLGTNSITLSGDINKSIDADCMAGMLEEDSTSGFIALLRPKGASLESFDDQLTLMKKSDALPTVGEYDIGENVESGEDFFAFFTANDITTYFMYSGSVEITESSTAKIAGTFNMTGYYGFGSPDSTRVLNVTGEFSTIPADLN